MDERWIKDYVLSVHRSMPNVKKTPRKPMKCLKCARKISDDKEYAYHVKVCQLSAMGCKECLVTFSAKKYYLQHIKRVHMVPKKHETSDVERNETEESEWDTEPDVSIGDDVSSVDGSVVSPKGASVNQQVSVPLSVNEGRIVRKQCSPLPPSAYCKKKKLEPCMVTVQAAIHQGSPPATAPPLQDKEVQTDVEIRSDVCSICGIRFDMQMMAYMHRGVHSVNDPLRCNVCGELCRDGGDFLTHITWGHVNQHS